MQGKRTSFIVFIVIEILLSLYVVFLFKTPAKNFNVNFERIYSVESKAYADNVIKIINNNEIPSLKDEFIEQVEKDENLENGLKALNDYFVTNMLESLKLVGCNVSMFFFQNERYKITSFTYDIKLKNGYGVLYIETQESNDTIKLRTFRMNPTEKPIEEVNDFYGHEIFGTRFYLLLLAILLPVFVMYTEYDYFKKSKNPRTWLQIAIAVLSIISIEINWTSLVLAIRAGQISLFPISLSRAGIAGAWYIKYHFPIMAVLYWTVFRKKELSLKKNT